MEAERPTLAAEWRWAPRVVACSFLILSGLMYSAFKEFHASLFLTIALLGIGGALLLEYGIELPRHPLARVARWVGWGMLLAVAIYLLRGSLVFLPLLLVSLALPAVIRAPRRAA